MSSQNFSRKEHLKGRKLIQTLFRKGKAFSVFPLKVYYLPLAAIPNQAPVRAGFSAPARTFRKAVQRNRIKRQMREAYRLQKHELQQKTSATGQSLALFFIYTGKKIPAYPLLFEKMQVSLNLLMKALQEKVQNEATE